MTDVAYTNRPSGEAPAVKDSPHRVPWTAICCGFAAIAAIMGFLRPCVPVDVDWKFADKTEVARAAKNYDEANVTAHTNIQSDLSAVKTDVESTKDQVRVVNGKLDSLDKMLQDRLPKKARHP